MRKKNNRWLFLIWFSFQPFKQIGNHGPFRFMTDACTSSVESIYFWKRQMFFYVVAVRRHVCRSWASTEEFIVRPRERGFRLSDKGILFLSSTFFFATYILRRLIRIDLRHIYTHNNEKAVIVVCLTLGNNIFLLLRECRWWEITEEPTQKNADITHTWFFPVALESSYCSSRIYPSCILDRHIF